MIGFLERLLGKKYREIVKQQYGVDMIADKIYNKRTGAQEIVLNKDSFVVYFVLPFDNDLHKVLGVAGASVPYDGVYICLNENCKCGYIQQITYDDIAEELKCASIPERKLLKRWWSEESRLAYEEERRKIMDLAVEKLKTLPLVGFDRDRTKADYLHLLYEMRYSPKDQKFCWDAYNHDYTAEDFPGTPDLVSNNRAFYVLNDGRYFVASKNNYDTFWASQGNGFESCFSLTSNCQCIRGVPFWIAHRGFYMCYITNGDVVKWSSFPGHKSKLPHMTARAWGYLRPDGSLSLGKTYDKTKNRELFWEDAAISNKFGNVKPNGFKVDTDLQTIPYKSYLDNMSGELTVSLNGFGYIGQSIQIEGSFKDVFVNTKFNPCIEYMDTPRKDKEGTWILRKVLPCGIEDTPIGRIINEDAKGNTGIRVYTSSINCFGERRFSGDLYVSGDELSYEVRLSIDGIAIYKHEEGNARLIATL